MSLTTALNIAQSALFNTSRQTGVVSNNIANAQNPNYSRRDAVLESMAPGATVVTIQRASDDSLLRANIDAQSSAAAQSTLLDGLNSLNQSVNGTNDASSPATAIGTLQQALDLYSTTPSNGALAQNAVSAAGQLVTTLNNASAAIQSFRSDTDGKIASAVSDLNNLLQSFDQANRAVVAATKAGTDASDALDKRDQILKQISQYVPVTTITRSGDDMMLTTAGGVTLYETKPRTVTFQPTASYGAGTKGNAVYIDGVPLEAGGGSNTSASGSIAAMLQLRDSVAPTMQSQLDEIARGLISSFAETDQSGTGQPDQTGLFTWSGGPSVPAGGAAVAGLAGEIKINPAFDPSAGGDAALLRDGGANGVDYVANANGDASYSDLLLKYTQNLESPMAFDPSAGAGNSASVMDYSTNSVNWAESARQNASSAADTKSALVQYTGQALSNATGVSIDEEMSTMLDLEHSYQASARMIKTVGDMLTDLLNAAA